ncbi:MAG: hypothetical protein SNH73_08325 [Rikenellaceae bacterium]
MKKLVNLGLAIFAFAAMASCSSSKAISEMAEGFSPEAATSSVTLTCSPEVLTLRNDVVPAVVSVDFAAGYFNSNVIAKVTPVMIHNDGEVAGTPFYFQGEDVEDNYTVVPEAGGAFSKIIEFPFTEEMQLSELQLRIELKNAKKATNSFYMVNANTGAIVSDGSVTAQESGVVVAVGVNTLQRDFCYASLMDPMADDYKAVTHSVSKADLSYDINNSTVKSSALTSSQIAAFKEVVEATQANESATQSVSANGYASPDGPEKLNDKLSSARSESAKKAMDKFFKEMGIEADVATYGEDWDGFKELVAASSIQDKNLILQVLSLYSSSAQREAEIKNLSSVYTELKDDILPELRRAQFVSNISVKGMSDDEMMDLVYAENYSELTLEEMLYLSSSVIEDNDTKVEVLTYAAKNFNDARAYNNLGIALAKAGDAEASLAAFNAATRSGDSSPTINKNLVLANLNTNNYTEAKKYRGDAKAAAALSAIEGNYAPAASNFEGYNAAVAHIMNNNYAAAKEALSSCKCAKGDYLRGVIASAEFSIGDGIYYIQKAVETDPSLKMKALSDINLSNLFEGGLVL